VKTKTKQTTNNKKKGGSPQNFVTIAALLHKNGG
jgi:hypothetical protein